MLNCPLDEDYISFLESLNASANAEPPTLEALSPSPSLSHTSHPPSNFHYLFSTVASTQQPPQPKTTPLLEALKAEKSANKDKEAILRNHAHYKDQISGAIARKDDKKKAAPAVQAQKVAEGAAAAGNKKAAGKKPQVATPAAAAALNQNQKPGQPKSVGNVPGPSNLGAKPPKPARAPRAPPPPQANKPQNVVVPIQTAIQQQPGPSTPTQPPPSDGATTPTPRRTRPVIGLASRQFEAALSGVAGGKSRREREREREREKEREEGTVTPTATAVSPSAPGLAQTPSMATASTPTGNVKEAGKPGPPTSPRRGRRGSHGGGGGSGGGGVGRPPSAASAVSDTKAPGIIQRADAPLIIQKDVPVVVPPVVSPVQMPMRGGRGGGGGLRRGRGRGRGGAPRGGFVSPTQGAVE